MICLTNCTDHEYMSVSIFRRICEIWCAQIQIRKRSKSGNTESRGHYGIISLCCVQRKILFFFILVANICCAHSACAIKCDAHVFIHSCLRLIIIRACSNTFLLNDAACIHKYEKQTDTLTRTHEKNNLLLVYRSSFLPFAFLFLETYRSHLMQ